MQSPEYREHCQRACHNVSEKQQEEKEIAHQEHGLAGTIVHDIAAERPYHQGNKRISRKSHPDRVICRPEPFAQIQGKQRHNQRKREVEQEIACPDLEIIAVPKSICHHQYCQRGRKDTK